jgi:pimeloyl-ACP methyl ester carboxylesterase
MKVYFSHATSFCGGVWRPVRDRLGEVETVAWDHPGHGSGPVIDLPIDWRQFGEAVLEVTEPGGIGVGHSMGAAALTMAQLTDPGRFQALVLIEPIIFPGPHRRDEENGMSLVAVKRKRIFESRKAAMANFEGRPLFSGWDPGALQGYMDCGFIGCGEVSLACAPEVEAEIYRGSNAHDTFERLGEIDVPVLLMIGKRSDTISGDMARRQAGQFPRAGLEIVPGAGHFLPMERPQLVSDRVRRLVEVAEAV